MQFTINLKKRDIEELISLNGPVNVINCKGERYVAKLSKGVVCLTNQAGRPKNMSSSEFYTALIELKFNPPDHIAIYKDNYPDYFKNIMMYPDEVMYIAVIPNAQYDFFKMAFAPGQTFEFTSLTHKIIVAY